MVHFLSQLLAYFAPLCTKISWKDFLYSFFLNLLCPYFLKSTPIRLLTFHQNYSWQITNYQVTCAKPIVNSQFSYYSFDTAHDSFALMHVIHIFSKTAPIGCLRAQNGKVDNPRNKRRKQLCPLDLIKHYQFCHSLLVSCESLSPSHIQGEGNLALPFGVWKFGGNI